MVHKLPDEILKEILSPVLNVEDESFSDTNDPSPFSLKDYSNSDILVVCKRWLRVATPLLYHVVILRSVAQSQALAYVLTKNRELGLFIKKIRVEGGFGASVHKIIVAAPRIKDIFLSLRIWSSDSVTGLCKGLPLMDPSRLILQDDSFNDNSKQRQLFTTLCECLKSWRNLKIIDLPCGFQRPPFTEALTKSQSLERLYVQPSYDMHYLQALARIPSMKAIVVRTSEANAFLDNVAKGPKLMALIQFEDPPPSSRRSIFVKPSAPTSIPVDIPSDSNAISPLSSASTDVQDKIWSRVLEFVLEIQLLDGELDHHAHYDDRTRGRLPLVSKRFSILAIPILYRFPMLFSPSALASFANQLVANPSLALHVRFLFVSTEGPSTGNGLSITKDMHQILSRTSGLVRLFGERLRWDSMLPRTDWGGLASQQPSTGMDIYQILSRTSGLVNLCSESIGWNGMLARMDWDGFNALAKSSGSTLLTLRNFEIDIPPSRQSPSVFNDFVKLRSLWWHCRTEFKVDRSQISCASLAALENIHFDDYDESFMQVLSLMELPSLLHVVFSRTNITNALPFLHKHGFKIRTLDLRECWYHQHPIFDMCPNMELLSISVSFVPNASFFRSSTENNKLAKIKLNVFFDRPNPFEGINLDNFKALTEIQSDFCHWPTTEREIAKDVWHVWAEEILLKWGVKFTDSKGRHWRPRLKPQRRS